MILYIISSFTNKQLTGFYLTGNIPVQLKKARVSVPYAIVAKVLAAMTLAVESTQEAMIFTFWSMLTRLTAKLS